MEKEEITKIITDIINKHQGHSFDESSDKCKKCYNFDICKERKYYTDMIDNVDDINFGTLDKLSFIINGIFSELSFIKNFRNNADSMTLLLNDSELLHIAGINNRLKWLSDKNLKDAIKLIPAPLLKRITEIVVESSDIQLEIIHRLEEVNKVGRDEILNNLYDI